MTVVIVGISSTTAVAKRLYSVSDADVSHIDERKDVPNINAYLVPAPNVEVQQSAKPMQGLSPMQFGNHPYYGAALIFSVDDARDMIRLTPDSARYIRPFYGSKEFIDCAPRACLWISDAEAESAKVIPQIAKRVDTVKQSRCAAVKDASAQKLALIRSGSNSPPLGACEK